METPIKEDKPDKPEKSDKLDKSEKPDKKLYVPPHKRSMKEVDLLKTQLKYNFIVFHGSCDDGMMGAWLYYHLLPNEIKEKLNKIPGITSCLPPQKLESKDYYKYQQKYNNLLNSKLLVSAVLALEQDLPVFFPAYRTNALPLTMMKDKDVLFIDFCPDELELKLVHTFAKSIFIIDHHESTFELKGKISPNIKFYLDKNKCGAQLCREVFYPTPTQMDVKSLPSTKKYPSPHCPIYSLLIYYIQDQDLCQVTMHKTQTIMAAIKGTKKLSNFVTIDKFMMEEENAIKSITKPPTVWNGTMKDFSEAHKVYTQAAFNVFYYSFVKIGIEMIKSIESQIYFICSHSYAARIVTKPSYYDPRNTIYSKFVVLVAQSHKYQNEVASQLLKMYPTVSCAIVWHVEQKNDWLKPSFKLSVRSRKGFNILTEMKNIEDCEGGGHPESAGYIVTRAPELFFQPVKLY